MSSIPQNIQDTLDKLKKKEKIYLEIKVIRGKYNVYHSTSVWDKMKKKPKKITKHYGVISPEGIFIPGKSRGRIFETSTEVYEYGACALAYSFLQDAEQVMDTLTEYSKELIAAAIVKAIDPQPIRLTSSKWEKFHLSKKMKVHISPKKLSEIMQSIGGSVTPWRELFFSLTQLDDFLLYDLTAVFTHSEKLVLAERMYNAHHKHFNQIGVVMAFSTSDKLPVGMEVYCGSIKDITTMYDFKMRYPSSNIGFIFDRGFFSHKLLVELAEDEIHYIVPLRKNSTYIDLRWLRWKSAFRYRKRSIRWARKKCDLGHVYFFEDPKIRGEEESNLLKKVEAGKLSMKEFEVERKKGGIIGIISDLEKNGIDIYDQYKSREDVDLAFDVMKNNLLSDKTYLRDTISVRGYFFITFLALRVHFKIIRRLREKDLTSKLSVKEVFMELSKMYLMIEKGGREYFSKVPKRARKIVDLFPEVRPMG